MESASWYSRLLINYPFIIFISVFIFSSTCVILPLTIKKFPDFSDPQIGFEARGTPLAQRIITWKNLVESSSPRGNLIDNPLEYYHYLQEIDRQKDVLPDKNIKKHHKKNKKKKEKNKPYIDKHNRRKEKNKFKRKKSEGKSNPSITDDDEVDENESNVPKKHLVSKTEFFCNVPSSDYARVVISSENKTQSLWSLDGILAQCRIDEILQASSHFSLLCQRQIGYKEKCCRSWSPANYVALLSNRTSCMEVTEKDVLEVENLLKKCSYFYQNLELTSDCTENLKCQLKVHPPCYTHNAIYYLLHYLLDVEFLAKKNDSNSLLSSAMTILPIAASSASLDYYYEISNTNLSYKSFSVSAIEFGLKSTLFDELLISDSFLLIFGFTFSILCIWFYTGSLVITVSTILIIIFSLGISYAIYTLILRIDLFPFMNLLAIVVAVGICADDAFIFCKIWECKKREMSININSCFSNLVHETMKHAAPSMFVTTLTTAVAFFASIVSNVTAINCFSLFSGITVIINFLLMVTFLPASVILVERYTTNIISSENCIVRSIKQPLQTLFDKVVHLFTEFIIRAVILLKWLWFIIFIALGIGSCYIVFKFPGLQLPNSPNFQLFESSHLFERYDLFFTKHFRFEKIEQGEGSEIVLPLRFVWGVLPIDNGDYFNPSSLGTLEFDESFDMSNRESQIWLQNFCKKLRLQRFYRSTFGPLLSNCFIESLQPWMERSCEDPVDSEINYFPCCEKSTFPYEPNVLKYCTAEAIAEIHRTPSHLWNFKTLQGSQSSGVKFRKSSENLTEIFESKNKTLITEEGISKIKVVIVEYDSNVSFSLSFTEMNNFFNDVENWMQKELLAAPSGMKNGWFVSHLEFYELQRTLYEGTIWTMVVSMGLTLSVLALITLNPFVSLYAIVAVGATIIVTVTILILLDWRLNVLESVAVSTAIGLAVDFNLHYAVSYRESTGERRIDRAKTALEQMAGPTLMAALTTGAAGALMLPSQVLAYIQIGMFLVIIMGVSWIYATFFLCPLLAIAGPSSHCAQFSYPRFKRSFNRRVADDSNELKTYRFEEREPRKSKELSAEGILSNSNRSSQFGQDPSRPPSPSTIPLNAGNNQTTNIKTEHEVD